MPASAHAKPISRREDALAIVRRLADAGHTAYFAGGCVRDQVLGLLPKDFDVATSATPDDVRRLFPKSQGVGQAFGVLLVRYGRSVIEVATFRADGSYSDGRRPDDVRFAGPGEDARRRDFTINGLFFDPLAERVIDLVGGVEDLKRRVLRAIGNPGARFAEDYLRMLRAVRFAARFDFSIEPDTADAIRANADRLPRIAPERIADELRSMLTASTRRTAVRLLDELGLMPVLFRRLTSEDIAGSPRNVFGAACAGETTFPLALAALAIDLLMAAGRSVEEALAPSSVQAIVQSLRQTFRLSNDETASIGGILAVGHLLVKELPRVSVMKRFLATPDAPSARRLLEALRVSGIHGDRIARLETLFADFAPDTIAPPPLVTGDDLTAAGFAPSPSFKRALDNAYDAQLEGRIASKAEAMAIATAILRAS